MNTSFISRLFTSLAGALAIVSVFLVWNDFLELSLIKWQEIQSRFGGDLILEPWLAVACATISGVIARVSAARKLAWTSLAVSGVGLAFLVLFVIGREQQLGGIEILGPGVWVAGAALLVQFVSSTAWAISDPRNTADLKAGE